MHKEITATINGENFTFNVTADHYERYVDDLISAKSKVAISKNFLVRCVDKEQKTALVELLKSLPAASVEIAGNIAEDFAPDVEITLGE